MGRASRCAVRGNDAERRDSSAPVGVGWRQGDVAVMCVVAMGGAVSLSAGQLLELVVRGSVVRGRQEEKAGLGRLGRPSISARHIFFLTSLSLCCIISSCFKFSRELVPCLGRDQSNLFRCCCCCRRPSQRGSSPSTPLLSFPLQQPSRFRADSLLYYERCWSSPLMFKT